MRTISWLRNLSDHLFLHWALGLVFLMVMSCVTTSKQIPPEDHEEGALMTDKQQFFTSTRNRLKEVAGVNDLGDLLSMDPSPSLVEAIRDARRGITNPTVADLVAAHWYWELFVYPNNATRQGVHDFDALIFANGPEARDRQQMIRQSFLEEARRLRTLELDPADTLTLGLFIQEIENTVASQGCRFHEWTVSPRSNPVTQWNYLPELHPQESLEDLRNLSARYAKIPASIRHATEALQGGRAEGLVANAESTRRVIEMVRTQLDQPMDEWPLLTPLEVAPQGADARELERVQRQIRETVTTRIHSALEHYVRVLEDEILPAARDDQHVGIGSLALGKTCYEARIRAFTTTTRTAPDIHDLGLSEIEKINDEMRELGERLFGTRELPEILERLRTDSALFFESEEQVEQAAREALAAAQAVMPEYFGRLPKATCTVVPIPEYEAPYTTIAYYRGPHPDGSKPGEYFINTFAPQTRPRFEARVLAFHESIPGHHLQIAIAQELPEVPAFRRHGGFTVFVEGWALYTERLAEEMGLYQDDLDRMGMLSYDAWRASRLVVDTGIHAKGWSREQARQFLEEHTALALNNIDNEVDRYINWPGQALAYKIGQLEIRMLRDKAQAELGEAFDIKAFHDVVLGGGALPLSALRARVLDWIESNR